MKLPNEGVIWSRHRQNFKDSREGQFDCNLDFVRSPASARSELSSLHSRLNWLIVRRGLNWLEALTRPIRNSAVEDAGVDGKKVYILRLCMIHGPGNKGDLNLLCGVEV